MNFSVEVEGVQAIRNLILQTLSACHTCDTRKLEYYISVPCSHILHPFDTGSKLCCFDLVLLD